MKTLTLNNRTFLAWPVEATSRVDLVSELFCKSGLGINYPSQYGSSTIPLPPGTYSEPFLLSQLDEERAQGIMTEIEIDGLNNRWFKDYDMPASGVTLYALESFHSWLRANGVLTENPMTKPDATKILIDSPCGADYEALDELKDKYDACQSQVSKEWVFVEQLTSK